VKRANRFAVGGELVRFTHPTKTRFNRVFSTLLAEHHWPRTSVTLCRPRGCGVQKIRAHAPVLMLRCFRSPSPSRRPASRGRRALPARSASERAALIREAPGLPSRWRFGLVSIAVREAQLQNAPARALAVALPESTYPSLALFDVGLFPIAFALATPSVARSKGLTSPKRQREGCVDQGGAGAALSLALRAGKHRGSRSATSKPALRARKAFSPRRGGDGRGVSFFHAPRSRSAARLVISGDESPDLMPGQRALLPPRMQHVIASYSRPLGPIEQDDETPHQRIRLDHRGRSGRG
jgi:hypothetical protein